MHEFIIDKCELIAESIEAIEEYFQPIHQPDDFKKRQNRVFFDAIMMRLQVIGENIKKIDKLQKDFFEIKLQFDTTSIIKFRELISHHYEKLDSDIIYDICLTKIPILKQKIDQLLANDENP